MEKECCQEKIRGGYKEEGKEEGQELPERKKVRLIRKCKECEREKERLTLLGRKGLEEK
jgi:hypothetical protein